MALTVDEIKVLISAEIEPYKKAMEQVKAQTQSVNNVIGKLKSLLAGLAIGTALFKLGKYSTQMALEVSASINQIKRLMGESSQSFLKWAKNGASAFNIAQSDAIKYGAIYSNLFSNFIKDNEQLAGYTTKMLQTSSVVASATGRSMDDVMSRIRSGMLGSTEAIEDLGINVNVAMIKSTNAFKQFANGQSWEQLDFNTQQAIRMLAILEQASTKYGDTVMQGPVSSLAFFVALLKDSALNIGNALLPVIQAIMPVLNGFAMVLRTVTGHLATFMQLLFGKTAEASGGVSDMSKSVGGMSKGLGDAGKGADKLADGVGKAGKAAKQAKKEMLGLMGFDEINTLPKNNDSTSDGSGGGSKGGRGGSGGAGSGGFQLPKVDFKDTFLDEDNSGMVAFVEKVKSAIEALIKRVKELVDLFKIGFNFTFRFDSIERLQNALSGIGQSIYDIFSDGAVLNAMNNYHDKLAVALGKITGAIANIIMGTSIYIAESFNKSLNNTKLNIKEWLIAQFEYSGNIASSVGNIAKDLSHIFYDVWTSGPVIDIGSHIITSITLATIGITDVAVKLGSDLIGGIEKIISSNAKRFTKVLTNMYSGIEPIFKSISDIVGKTFSKFSKIYDVHIKPFVDSFISGVSKLVGSFINMWDAKINPVLTAFGQKFQSVVNDYVQPMLNKLLELLGAVADALTWLWETVLQPFVEMVIEFFINRLGYDLSRLSDTFIFVVKTISNVISGLIETIKGIIDFLVGVFTGDWERAWNGVQQILSGVWNTIIAIFKMAWDAIMLIFGVIGKWFSSQWENVKAVFKFTVKFFEGIFKGAWNGIVSIFSVSSSWFSGIWNGIKNVFSGVNAFFGNIFKGAWNTITGIFSAIPNWFSNVFSRAWAGVRDVFSTGGRIFAGIVDGIAVTFRRVVNAIIGGINGVIAMPFNAINGALDGIRGVNIMGISPFGWLPRIGVPRIPMLAKGGIVNSATLAIVGEAGREAVMPLENNTGWITELANKLNDRMPNTAHSNRPMTVVLNLPNGKEFARWTVNSINELQASSPYPLLNI